GGFVTRGNWFVRTFAVLAGLALAGALTPRPSQAQGISFTPYVGSFYALKSFVDVTPQGGSHITIDQSNTAVFGARLTLPIGGTLSVEGAFGYAKSDVILREADACVDPANFQVDCSTNFSGNIITGSGRLLFKPRRANIWAILGGSYIKHSGKAWDDSSTPETGDIGGVVGFGMRAVITSRIALNLTAEATVYSFDPDGKDTLFDSKTQTDLIFSVGFPISLSH
ncbi:MAG: hypothetical protein ABI836_05495, partial [Gemmatimonadota bacterium]